MQLFVHSTGAVEWTKSYGITAMFLEHALPKETSVLLVLFRMFVRWVGNEERDPKIITLIIV